MACKMPGWMAKGRIAFDLDSDLIVRLMLGRKADGRIAIEPILSLKLESD